MMTLNNIVVLIPALDPNNKLVSLVKELKQIGMDNILVIDDGSGRSSQAVFAEIQTYQVEVYHHKHNQGKGAALKTGITYIKEYMPQVTGIVTADADGQHAPNDIFRITMALMTENTIVLGTRDLSQPDVPLTSKIGNLFSAVYFRLKTGMFLKDTQTGLRGIPARYFDYALNIEGDRYEYEMRFLEQMSENDIPYRTVDIETIYEEDRVTHFRTVSDSYVIYKQFFKNIGSSLLSALIDISAFMLFSYAGYQVFLATVIARVLSGTFNFVLNKVWVFKMKDSHNTKDESLKYLGVFTMQMILSGYLTALLSGALVLNNSLLLSKILVDGTLFITNFIVQRLWIFPSNHMKLRIAK